MIEILKANSSNPFLEVILPTNENPENFIYQLDIIYIDNPRMIIYDIDKKYANHIYFAIRNWVIKNSSFDKVNSNYAKKFYILCKHNDQEKLLECGFKIYETIRENYKTDKSYKLTIEVGKTGGMPGFPTFKTNFIQNYDWLEFKLTNKISVYIDELRMRLNKIENNFDNIDKFLLKKYNLSMNTIRNNIRSKKLKKHIIND